MNFKFNALEKGRLLKPPCQGFWLSGLALRVCFLNLFGRINKFNINKKPAAIKRCRFYCEAKRSKIELFWADLMNIKTYTIDVGFLYL
jgi:hypothetical protein